MVCATPITVIGSVTVVKKRYDPHYGNKNDMALWQLCHLNHLLTLALEELDHGLWTPGQEIAFTERPKIHSHSQIFRYGRSIFCLPDLPEFSDFFDLCLHWVSVVRELDDHM